jgi:hypothetical protein
MRAEVTQQPILALNGARGALVLLLMVLKASASVGGADAFSTNKCSTLFCSAGGYLV